MKSLNVKSHWKMVKRVACAGTSAAHANQSVGRSVQHGNNDEVRPRPKIRTSIISTSSHHQHTSSLLGVFILCASVAPCPAVMSMLSRLGCARASNVDHSPDLIGSCPVLSIVIKSTIAAAIMMMRTNDWQMGEKWP